MKKICLLLIALGTLSQINAQFIEIGAKAGLNYNENGSLKSIGESITRNSNEEMGYHLGLFSQINLPIIYIRPELVYTNTNSSYLYDDKRYKMELQKIDVPVLLGIKVLRYGRAFIGPAFQYILDTEFSSKDIKNIAYDDFTLGMQIGLGVQIKKFGFDVRWERGLSDSEAEFIQRNTDNAFKVDTRAKQFIFGLSYRFN